MQLVGREIHHNCLINKEFTVEKIRGFCCFGFFFFLQNNRKGSYCALYLVFPTVLCNSEWLLPDFNLVIATHYSHTNLLILSYLMIHLTPSF